MSCSEVEKYNINWINHKKKRNGKKRNGRPCTEKLRAYWTVGVKLHIMSKLPYMERKKPNMEITTPYKEA